MKRRYARFAAMFCFGFMLVLFTTGAKSCYRKPNIILILTDDQRWDTIDAKHSFDGTTPVMPSVFALANQGVSFSNAFVTTPICEPSRASILSGFYAHNHEIFTGSPDVGGAYAFHQNGGDAKTIATWLKAAGYRTGYFGKYMNNYQQLAPTVPPGWDDWHAMVNNLYFDYDAVVYNVDTDPDGDRIGAITHHGTAPEDYSTDVFREKVLDFINANQDQPFFALFAPFAPHNGAVVETGFAPQPAPRHEGMFDGVAPYRPPSWNESDLSDKPFWVYAMAAQSSGTADFFRQKSLESLQAVDEAVGMMNGILSQLGLTMNTIVIYTSDNGFAWDEHYWRSKMVAYEESVRVPLIIRYPWLLGWVARSVPRVVANIDLAPSILDLAGVSAWDPVDGVSFKPLLLGQPVSWRTDLLLEDIHIFPWPPDYQALVRQESSGRLWKLIRDGSLLGYFPPEDELYLLADPNDGLGDPYELDNLLLTDPENPYMQVMAESMSEGIIAILPDPNS